MDSFITALDNFLSLCFAPKYHAFYIPKTAYTSTVFNLFIIDETFALTDLTYSKGQKSPILFSFSQTDVIQKLTNMYMNVVELSTPLVKNTSDKCHHINILLRSSQQETLKLCILDSTPFLFPVSTALFKEVLQYNRFQKNTLNNILENYIRVIYAPLTNPKQTYKNNHLLWDTAALMENLQQEEFLFPSKLIAEEPIRIPHSLYKKYLEEIAEYILKNKDNRAAPFSICLTDHQFDQLPKNTLVYALDDLYTYIYSYSTAYAQNHLNFTNPAITSDAYSFLYNIWNISSEEQKNAKNILHVLGQMLKQL